MQGENVALLLFITLIFAGLIGFNVGIPYGQKQMAKAICLDKYDTADITVKQNIAYCKVGDNYILPYTKVEENEH